MVVKGGRKQQLGQFFTTNVDFILRGLGKYLDGKHVSDPFVGNRDLLHWAGKYGCGTIEGFDVDENYIDGKVTFLRDSIKTPGRYHFILTNPPYLHKNKASPALKETYASEYDAFEDLYQISINSMLNAEEGIMIVPLNFLSASNASKIRQKFFAKFRIVELNLFTKPVFEDTTYNVIAFYFKKSPPRQSHKINANFVFENRKIEILLQRRYDWEIGGEFLSFIRQSRNVLGIERLTCDNKNRHDIDANHLILTAIDTRREKLNIKLKQEIGIRHYIGKASSRNRAHLIFGKKLSRQQQLKLRDDFNDFMQVKRSMYSDLFLTNFRDHNRKRISFNFTYKLLNHLYEEHQKVRNNAQGQLNLS